MLTTIIIAAWQDACDLILLTKQGLVRLHCQDRSTVIDKLNRPVRIRPDLGLVFTLN